MIIVEKMGSGLQQNTELHHSSAVSFGSFGSLYTLVFLYVSMKPVGIMKPQVCLRGIKSRTNSNFLLFSLGQNLFLEMNSSGIDELINH